MRITLIAAGLACSLTACPTSQRAKSPVSTPTYTAATPHGLRVAGPQSVAVFGTVELAVTVPPQLLGHRGRFDGEIHDAYDADRDGRYLRLEARFSRHEGKHVITVPGFALRETAGGP